MNILLLLASFAAAQPQETGFARLKGTEPGSKISGELTFEENQSRELRIAGTIRGLKPGVHAFHIHESGSCDDKAQAAGGHFNPSGAPHGNALEHGPKRAHAGDTGNVTADAQGNAAVDVVLAGVSLTNGSFPVAGRAVVVHEKADDFKTQPTGDAGGRVACGVIGVMAPKKAAR